MLLPDNLTYTASHEWVLLDKQQGVAAIGITAHAQEALGDIVFLELPTIGKQVAAGEAIAVIESVKAASDIYAPVSGEVVEVNEALAQAPESLSDDPYAAWLFKLKLSDATAPDALLSAAAYREAIGG